MKGYEIKRSETTLTIRRRKSPALLGLLFFLSVLCLELVIPFANIFIYHYFVLGSIWLAVMLTLSVSPMLVGFGRRLEEKTIVLDNIENKVIINGRCVCALADVRSVQLGKYIAPSAKSQVFTVRGLYLKTAKGEAVELERATNTGSNYKEVASTIASFARVNDCL